MVFLVYTKKKQQPAYDLVLTKIGKGASPGNTLRGYIWWALGLAKTNANTGTEVYEILNVMAIRFSENILSVRGHRVPADA